MVIDELIVILGLDASKFTEGQRDALSAFKKGREGAEEFGKDVERQGMKLSEVFGIVRKGALGIVGAFAGGEAAAFINHVAGMDAATGRMSRTISTSVENLSTWQGMIRQIGGEAGAATSTLSALQQEINSVRQGGGMFEGGFASLMNQSGASIRDDADTMLRKIRAFLAGRVESGGMKPDEAATFMRRVPGMNQDMVNLLGLPTREFNDLAESARKAGTANNETAASGALLQKAFAGLILAVENAVRRVLPAVSLLTKPVGQIGAKDVADLLPAEDPDNPTFEPGSPMDRLFRWQYRLTQGKEYQPPGKPPAAATPAPAPAAAGTGRSRGDRNNNPGNIEFGPFARAHGAVGTDGRFAIFPDAASGESAMADLLMKSYSGLTLAQIQRKWVGNEDPGYLGSMSRSTGLGAGEVPNLGDAAVRQRLISGMARGEGSQLGARGAAAARAGEGPKAPAASTSSTTVTIGQITLPGVRDADDFAREIEPVMRRQSMVAPINTGLA